jgi:hypothetical protein
MHVRVLVVSRFRRVEVECRETQRPAQKIKDSSFEFTRGISVKMICGAWEKQQTPGYLRGSSYGPFHSCDSFESQ